MTSNSVKPSSTFIGFVDTFENGNFSGWCYDTEKKEQEIVLKINSNLVATIPATVIRTDVAQQLKIPPVACGFNFTLQIDKLPPEGCVISFHESTHHKILNNGTFTYEHGRLATGAIKPSYGHPLPISTYVDIVNSVKSDLSAENFVNFAVNKLKFASPANFVALSYILILGRTPDPDGFLNSLHTDLNTDSSRRDFLSKMVSSIEFNEKRTISNAMRDLAKID